MGGCEALERFAKLRSGGFSRRNLRLAAGRAKSHHQRGHFPLDPCPARPLGHFEIVFRLEPDPEGGGGAEKFRQSQGSLGAQAAPTLGDLGQARGGNTSGPAHGSQAQAHRLDELLKENLPGMNQRKVFGCAHDDQW